MKLRSRFVIRLGLIFTILSLICSIVSLSTDHWVDVHRTTAAPPINETIRHEHHPHHYGLLRECVDDNSSFPGAHPLDLVNQHEWFDSVLGTRCFYIDFQIPSDDDVEFGKEEWRRFHLMRATFGLMAISIFFLFLSVILGFYVVDDFRIYDSNSLLQRFNTFWLCFCALVIVGALACFHGKTHLEERILTSSSDVYTKDGPFKGQPKRLYRRGMTSEELSHVLFRFSWSYALAWIACAFAAGASFCFAIVGRMVLSVSLLNDAESSF